MYVLLLLKEYYEIVDEARPLSGFFSPHMLIFYRNVFLIMKLCKLQSFRVIQALIASQSTFRKMLLFSYWFFFVTHYTQVF